MNATRIRIHRSRDALWATVTLLAVGAALTAGCGGSAPASTKATKVPRSFAISEFFEARPHGYPKMHYRIGGFAVTTSMDRAARFFGKPEDQADEEIWGSAKACNYDWASIGVSILAEDTCDVPDNPIWMVTLTDRRWHTQRGLHVGDSLARLRHLYPKAHHEPYIWYIDERPEVVFLRAQIEHGRVDMIYLFADCKDRKCRYGV